MSRRRTSTGNDFERVHEKGEAHTLAVVLLDDSTFDPVDQWTPLDEVISVEAIEIPEEQEHCMIISRDDYDTMLACVELVERQRGEKLAIDESTHRKVLPGCFILTADELMAKLRKAKSDTFNALMRYVWSNARNLWGAMRNWLAITHKIAPQFIKGMSGPQIGKLLGVGRAAFNKTEITLVVDYLQKWGVKGGTAGGSKPVGHREKKREQMLGRRHRAGDYESDAGSDDLPPMTDEQRQRANDLRDEHERKYMAQLAGVDPGQIDLKKLKMTA